MLAVGLKDFVAHGTSQKAQIVKEGSINLARVPKINSVVGILGHLVNSFSIVLGISGSLRLFKSQSNRIVSSPLNFYFAWKFYLVKCVEQGGTHEREVFASIRKMVAESLSEDEDEDEEMDEAVAEELRDLHIATIPYFLYLSSLSDMISSALLKDVLQFVDIDVAGSYSIRNDNLKTTVILP